MVPIFIGALGYVRKCFEMYFHQLGLIRLKQKLVQKLQNMFASGNVKICKTFLSFHDS